MGLGVSGGLGLLNILECELRFAVFVVVLFYCGCGCYVFGWLSWFYR